MQNQRVGGMFNTGNSYGSNNGMTKSNTSDNILKNKSAVDSVKKSNQFI